MTGKEKPVQEHFVFICREALPTILNRKSADIKTTRGG